MQLRSLDAQKVWMRKLQGLLLCLQVPTEASWSTHIGTVHLTGHNCPSGRQKTLPELLLIEHRARV